MAKWRVSYWVEFDDSVIDPHEAESDMGAITDPDRVPIWRRVYRKTYNHWYEELYDDEEEPTEDQFFTEGTELTEIG